MEPIDFTGTNLTLTRPKEWPDDQPCGDLHALKGHDEFGRQFFRIAYVPTAEDLLAMEMGRPLFIQVTGAVFQPIRVWTTNEKGEINP